MLESLLYFICMVCFLVINFKDLFIWFVLVGYFYIVFDFIKSFIIFIRDKVFGQRECDYFIDGINWCIWDIEQVLLVVVSQSLVMRDDIFVEVLQEQLILVVQEIGYFIDFIVIVVWGEVVQLGYKVI